MWVGSNTFRLGLGACVRVVARHRLGFLFLGVGVPFRYG